MKIQWWIRQWYQRTTWLNALLPLEYLYRLIIKLRTLFYRKGWCKIYYAPVPVIIIGNITVGGTGKTPCICTLANLLQQAGWHPGIIMRGYGGRAKNYPILVNATTPVEQAGDEAVMLANQLSCPIVVAPKRVIAAKELLKQGCDIILSDDGLQHYALARNLEIVLIDGLRGLGNQHCLPVGPLREPISRLNTVDAIIINSARNQIWPRSHFNAHIQAKSWIRLIDNYSVALIAAPFKDKLVHAVAGIGNPERFLQTLRELNIHYISHIFPDHHQFTAQDLMFDDDYPCVMTAKDAVKCREFCDERCWYLAVDLQLSNDFNTWLFKQLTFKMALD